jgi:DinB family protein
VVSSEPADISQLREQLEAVDRDAEALVAGLSEQLGTGRPETGGWSVAECLDHLAIANRVYLKAMQEPAQRARTRGRLRRRPAMPGWPGRLFCYMLEPPPKWWSNLKAPGIIKPRQSPPLGDSVAAFKASQAEMIAFLRAHADLDLASIRFRNPFVGWIHFSLATGLHVTGSHERRHLAQAWRIRRALERNAS